MSSPRPAEASTFQASPGLPRWIDASAAAFALLLLSPVLLLAALAVKLSSPGPILFRQQRIGLGGEAFTFYKFRSMRVHGKGVPLTASGDSRVTAVGKVLRKLKIDEFPGFLNVLLGDLALVGPRPEVPRYVESSDPLWSAVLSARPGLTDPVTLRLRNEEELLGALDGDPETFYTSYLLPFKLRGYRNYLRRRSALSDCQVVWDTALGVIFPGRNPPPTREEIARLWGGEEASSETLRTPVPWTRRYLRQAQFLLDLAVFAAAFLLAYALRFEFELTYAVRQRMWVQLPMVMVVQLVAYYLSGIHSFVWRYISLTEVQAFVRGFLISSVPLILARVFLPERYQSWRVPFSVILISAGLAFGGLLALRVARRMDFERRQRLARRKRRREVGEGPRPVLIYGAGIAGVAALREIQARGDSDVVVQGFIDDDPTKHGTVIRGIRVLGSGDELAFLIRQHKIHHVLLSLGDASPLELGRVLALCHKIPTSARILPRYDAVMAESLAVQEASGDSGEVSPLAHEPNLG
ncbi:MAG: sugar transferase [Acidobacteriota bacterium]